MFLRFFFVDVVHGGRGRKWIQRAFVARVLLLSFRSQFGSGSRMGDESLWFAASSVLLIRVCGSGSLPISSVNLRESFLLLVSAIFFHSQQGKKKFKLPTHAKSVSRVRFFSGLPGQSGSERSESETTETEPSLNRAPPTVP
jgi:hypothetical protein